MGVVDDESLPAGRYQVRARATDRAGNEQTAIGESDGSPIPATTRLTVGHPKRDQSARHRRTTLPTHPGQAADRALRAPRSCSRAASRRRVEIHWPKGISTWPNSGPTPAPCGSPSPRSEQTRTDASEFRALPGPSRQLRFRYGGTPTVRGHEQLRSTTGSCREHDARKPTQRGERRGSDLQRHRPRRGPDGRQASAASSVLARVVADVCDAASQSARKVASRVPIHGDPRCDAVPIPRPGSA